MPDVLHTLRAVTSGALTALLVAAAPAAAAIEEPSFTVIVESGHFQVRRYEPFVIAEIEIAGDFEDAGSEAFGALFSYISGANRGEREIEMTAPVLQVPKPGETIDTTAPVLQRSSVDAGAHLVSFVLPRQFTLDTAPLAEDPRIALREVPARTVAAVRYSGFWSEANFREREAELLAAVAEAGYEPVAGTEWARYNGPLTPWFLRRNEVLVEVRRRDGAS